MLKLEVSQFGPIISGNVGLRPFNIFVGPNNAGKSYMATLIYAVLHSVQRGSRILPPIGQIRRFYRLYRQRYYVDIDWEPAIHHMLEKKAAQSVKAWIQSVAETKQEKVGLGFGELPGDIRDALHKAIDQMSQDFVSSLSGELRRCFGSDIGDLACIQQPIDGGLGVSIKSQKPLWHMKLACSDSKLYMAQAQFNLENQSFQLPARILRFATAKRFPTEMVAMEVLGSLLEQATHPFVSSFPNSTYYLPAARSGILQSHKALASFVVSRSPLVGIEQPLDIPKLSGVVTDFIASLLTLERQNKTKLYDIATFLEREVIGGEVDIDAGKLEYPEIYYRPSGGKFPLHRTSSMVSELAPIILFLKYVIAPGDFLIIEEPESHLHPAVQRKLAQAIPRLIRSKVTVLITSHSDYFLEQLSNIIRLSGVSEEERKELGYTSTDYLDPNEVGAYLFDLDPARGGSVVKELPVTRSDGIAEEDLSLVAEQLYGETVQLDRRIKA